MILARIFRTERESTIDPPSGDTRLTAVVGASGRPGLLTWCGKDKVFGLVAAGLFDAAIGLALPIRAGESAPPVTNRVAAGGTSLNTSSNSTPNEAFVVRRLEWINPLTAARLIPVTFPRELPAYSIDSMSWLDRRLWLGARPWLAPPTNWTTARFMVFTPEANRLEAVHGVLERHHPSIIWGRGKELWMPIEGGLALYDLNTMVVDGFNAYQGLTSSNLVGFAEVEEQVVTMSDTGVVFGMDRSGTNFIRLGSPAPALNSRSPDPWTQFTASGAWVFALGTNAAAFRHLHAADWQEISSSLMNDSPRFERAPFRTVTGDGSGAFWIGSDAGLHRLLAETGAIESQFVPPGVLITSGAAASSVWTRPTATGLRMNRERMVAAIRTRMRERARYARVSIEAKKAIDPVTPTSRLPGGVRCLLRDKTYLWVATTDGFNVAGGRILLFHLPSQKWLGWFAVGAPVRSLAVNDRWLWIGLDASGHPKMSPLVMVDKMPLLLTPAAKWVPAEITEGDLQTRLTALPVKERALFYFFSRRSQEAIDLLSPMLDRLDAESLFVLAMAHDPIGVDQPEKVREYIGLLRERFPGSVFADAIPSSPEREPPTAAPEPAPTEPENAAAILKRRDLDGDGRLNAIEFRFWKGEGADFKAADLDGDGSLGPEEIEKLIRGASK